MGPSPRALRRVAIVAMLAMFVPSCGDDDRAAEPTPSPARTAATVEVLDNEYLPAEVVVTTGGTVTWTYTGPIGLHTVTEPGGAFDSHPGCPNDPDACMRADGETFAHTFTTPGTVTYVCKVHGELMSGRVIVQG